MKPRRPEQQSLFERTPDEKEQGLTQIAEIKARLAEKFNDRRLEGRRE